GAEVQCRLVTFSVVQGEVRDRAVGGQVVASPACQLRSASGKSAPSAAVCWTTCSPTAGCASARIVKRAMSKYQVKGRNINRHSYKATLDINILAAPGP